MENTCLNCEWFVEETKIIGDFQHKEAVKNKKGFCLLKDLYTMQNPDDEACESFFHD